MTVVAINFQIPWLFPDFSSLFQISLTNHLITWLFPDLEKFNFPNIFPWLWQPWLIWKSLIRFIFEIFHILNICEVTVGGDRRRNSLFLLVFHQPIFQVTFRIFHLHSANHSSKVDENLRPRENHLSPIKQNLPLRQMSRALLFKALLG